MFMNKLKFRAWIKDYIKESSIPKSMRADYGFPKMVTPLCVYSENGFEYQEGLGYRKISKKDYDFVLMQFTGLKDRDGREIYEGDIIKLDRTDCNEIGIKLHVDKVRRSETGGYHVDDKCLYKCRLKKCEVIGNIYENPELLNQELEDVED